MANLKEYNVKPDKKAIGERINQLRVQLGLSMSKMGERLGLSKGTLNSYIRGLAFPPSEVIESISILAGTRPHWIIYGDIEDFIKSYVLAAGHEKLLMDYPKLIEDIFKVYQQSGYENEGIYYLNYKHMQDLFNQVYQPIFLSYIENVIEELSFEAQNYPINEEPEVNRLNFIHHVQMKVLNTNKPSIRYGEDKSILQLAEIELKRFRESSEINETTLNNKVAKFRTKLITLSKELDNLKEIIPQNAYNALNEGLLEFLCQTEFYVTELDRLQIGQRIKTIREKQNWTLEQFGLLVDNASKGTVSNWENGVYVPDKKRLSLIALLGNTQVDWILYGIADT